MGRELSQTTVTYCGYPGIVGGVLQTHAMEDEATRRMLDPSLQRYRRTEEDTTQIVSPAKLLHRIF